MNPLWMASLLAFATCAASAPIPGHEALTADAEPLRTAFNAAQGKVRAVFLASPT